MAPLLPALAALAALGALAACDPCAGTAACSDPMLRNQGKLILKHYQEPAEGVLVEFVPHELPGGFPDTLRATSRADGTFLFEAPAALHGEVRGDLYIHVDSPAAPVRIRNRVLETTDVGGQVRHFGTWEIPHWHFRSAGELRWRSTGDPVEGAVIEARRTGGVPIRPESWVSITGPSGRFALDPRPLDYGVLELEITVRPPPPAREFVIRDFPLQVYVHDNPNPLVLVRAIGPHLPWAGFLAWEDTREPASGVEVTFRRTGGVATSSDSIVAVTNEWGTFPLGLPPLEHGTLIGELEVRPPAPYLGFTVSDIRLDTTEEPLIGPIAGTWLIPRE